MGKEPIVWNPSTGRATRAFDDWHLGERSLRAFYRLGRAFASEGYERRWDRLASEPSDGEGPDLLELMDREVDGFTDIDFSWLLGNLCVRDGVTLYEVYLEKLIEEIYSRQIAKPLVRDRSPSWQQLAAACKVVGVDAVPQPVRDVIALRDLLTHRRGELRTEAHRRRYDTHAWGLPDVSIELPPAAVHGCLDALGAAVEEADRVGFPLAWGSVRSETWRNSLLGAVAWLA